MAKDPGRLPPAEPKASELAAAIVRMHPVREKCTIGNSLRSPWVFVGPS